ncbi:MAG TPA: type II toxin-antitoxin system prevent-host-death family antitoxin [Cytophagaceae bacterium]|jgi:antitoxin YefM
MRITTFVKFRQNLDTFLNDVVKDHQPLIIRRKNGKDVVILAREDYSSFMETLYLLQSPKNAERLKISVQQYQDGLSIEKHLME